MKLRSMTFVLFTMPVACGGPSKAPEAPVAASPSASVAPAAASAPAPASSAPAASVAAAPSAAPATNMEDAPATAQEWAAADAAAAKEAARFTPELRAKTKALATASYPTLHAGLTAALKSPYRKPGNADRDRYRHPMETLEFFGITPKMTVLEYGPGQGWYTELLAPVLAKKGKLVVTTADPKGPKTERSALGAHREALWLDNSPELYGKVERVVIDSKHPALPEDGTLDAALLIREMHGMQNAGQLKPWLDAIHRALKPKGVLGVVQHRAAPGANPESSAKNGYLPEAWVIAQVEQAGFKLAGKSEVNANPKDTKDYPEGVWTLPPTYRLKDKDRAKYAAIGESDRMTLKFVKVGK